MSTRCPVCGEEANFYCYAVGSISAVLFDAETEEMQIDGSLDEFYDSAEPKGPFQCSECGATFQEIGEIQ